MGVLVAGTVSRSRTVVEPRTGGKAVRALLAEIVAAPLDEVVARRDEAVRRLRAEGRRGDAAQVARLRRPSPALWAVDRLQQVDRVALREVLACADAVREAQFDLLGGRAGAAGKLTAAGRDLSAAVGRAAQSALRLLAAEGHGAGAETERRIQSMLRAAALGDEAVRAALEEGRLTEEPQPEGFGAADGPVPPPAPPAEALSRSVAAAQARARRLELERAVVVRRGAAAEAERAAASSRARTAASRAELVALETRAEQLRERLASEDAELRSAEERAAETRAALERANTALG